MKSKTHGFTLIELLVVIAIIAILAGMLLAGVFSSQDRAKKAATRETMKGTGMMICEAYDRNPAAFKKLFEAPLPLPYFADNTWLPEGFWGLSAGEWIAPDLISASNVAHAAPAAHAAVTLSVTTAKTIVPFGKKEFGQKLDVKNFEDVWGNTFRIRFDFTNSVLMIWSIGADISTNYTEDQAAQYPASQNVNIDDIIEIFQL